MCSAANRLTVQTQASRSFGLCHVLDMLAFAPSSSRGSSGGRETFICQMMLLGSDEGSHRIRTRTQTWFPCRGRTGDRRLGLGSEHTGIEVLLSLREPRSQAVGQNTANDLTRNLKYACNLQQSLQVASCHR